MTALTVRVADLVEADPDTTRVVLERSASSASRVYVSGTGAGTVVTLEKRLARGGLFARGRALRHLEAELAALREELESAQVISSEPGGDTAQEGNRC